MTAPRGSTTKRLLTNGAWNALSTVVAGAAAFVLVPLLLAHLGEDAYGTWILVGSVFAYASVLHFGLSSAINRHVPLALARGSDDDIRRVVTTGTVFFGGVALVLLVGTAVVYRYLEAWFNLPAGMADAARGAVAIVGGLLAVTVLLQTFGAALSGYQRYDLNAIARIVMILARGLALVIALRRGGGLLAVAWIYGLTELGVNALQYAFGARLMPRGLVRPAMFDRALLRDMLFYGGNTFLYSSGAVVAYKASELLLGVFRTANDVARYSVAAAGVLTLAAVVESFSAAIKPAVSDLDARDEAATIRALSLATQKLSLFIILPSTAFLVLMGGDFVRVWTGLDDAQLAWATGLVAVGQAFRLAQQSNFLVLVGKGEHRFFGMAVLLVGVLTITSTALAVGVFDLGLVGAAGASCASWAIVSGIIIPRHVDQRLGIAASERRRRVLGPALAAALPGILVLAAWKWAHAPGSWLEIGAIVGVVALVTAAGAWAFGLEPHERDRVRRAVTVARPTG